MRAHRARATRRANSSIKRRLRIEPLEPRVLLDGDGLWLTQLVPTGGAGAPFDTMELMFSEAVQDDSLTLGDVALEGPGGPIVPAAITRLAPDRYELDATGLTGLDTYSLTIGPDVLADATGEAMDQDRDGTPGEADDDAYVAALFAGATAIPEGDTTYDGMNLVLCGSTASVDGAHAFAGVQVLGAATLNQNGTPLDVQDLTVDGASTVAVAGGSTLNVDGTLALTGSSTLLALSINRAAQVGGEWAGEGATINAGNVAVEAGSAISADAQGYLGGSQGPGKGPGAGTAWNSRDGGSYGGLGGGSDTVNTYGDPFAPVDLGSGGGGYWGYMGAHGRGGAGGGAIRLNVSGTLALDGEISADGESMGTGEADGGGSGGAIYAMVGTLTGAGRFTADGGSSLLNKGGAGGGGRIAVTYGDGSGFTGFTTSSAAGGTGLWAGAAGTVGFLDTSLVGNHLRVYERFALGEEAAFALGAVTLSDGALLDIGGGTTLDVDGTLALTGSSTLVAHAVNRGGQVEGQWAGAGITINAAGIAVEAGSAISADAQGYLGGSQASGKGPGAGIGKDGGSYGGLGGGSGTDNTYGDPLGPIDLGSGGGGYRAVQGANGKGGAGGGAIRLTVSGTLALDGEISADGESMNTGEADGGGSGGSIYVVAGTLTGAGSFRADGGSSLSNQGGGGGGGRIVVSAADATGTGTASALGGTGTYGGGGGGQVSFYTLDGDTGGWTIDVADGTALVSEPVLGWTEPLYTLFHDTREIAWRGLGFDPGTTNVEFITWGAGGTNVVEASLPVVGATGWDTTEAADGETEIRVTFRDAGQQLLGEIARTVLINNAAAWHTGTLAADETWSPDALHVVEGDITIPDGVTLTIDPGTIVKFGHGTRITVETGGILDAPATEAQPIVLTSLTDDSVAGDTNFDGSHSIPQPGDWIGIAAEGGQAILTEFVDVRYIRTTHSGALAADEAWMGTHVHHITADLVVPAGVTLTINPGAVVKFANKKGIVVEAGGHLVAEATVALPITFTSVKDDSVGGDTNADGDATSPDAGDWRWIYIAGEASFDHARLTYGAGTASGNWDTTGVIRTIPGAVVTMANSVIRDAFYEGVTAYPGGDVTLTNTVIAGTDRAANSDGSAVVRLINCTLDDNRIGIWGHWGAIEITNCIISNSLEAGIDNDGRSPITIHHTNVWSTTGVNYIDPDPTGTNGNISADPLYKNAEDGNYRLNYVSPAIDAADGDLAPETDHMGAPRYDDPRTPNTGTPTPGGAYADMGAFEFVETADSDVDLVVTFVLGPSEVVAGEIVQVSWTVTNTGSATVSGSWHDRIVLVSDVVCSGGAELLGGEVLSVAALGPGQSSTFAADVVVPGATEATYHWEVQANTQGEVFEGANWQNNSTRQPSGTALRVPELELGAPIAGTFDTVGQTFHYKVCPGSGTDLSVSLDRADAAGWSQVFVGEGFMPTSEDFSWRSAAWNEPDALVGLGNTAETTYYVLVTARTLPSGPVDFTLSADEVIFSLSAVGATEGGNTGSVTLPIEGAGFRPDMDAGLVDTTGAGHAASAVYFADPSLAYATFDLTGLPLGSCDIWVEQQGVQEQLDDAFEVVEGTAPTLRTSLAAPALVRVGREYVAWVEYVNLGNVDLASPLIHVTNTSGGLLTLDAGGDPDAGTATFLAVSMDGPAGILRPGESGRLPVRILALAGSNAITLGYALQTEAQPMDWAPARAAVRPETACEKWDVMWDQQIASYGDTVGDYVRLLSSAATRYWVRTGGRTHDVSDTLGYLVGDNMADVLGTLSGHVYLGDPSHAVGGVTVVAFDPLTEATGSAVSTHDGLVRFRQLPAGTYDLSFVDYAPPADLDPVVVPGDGAATGHEWIIERAGTIVGHVEAPQGTDFAGSAACAYDDLGNTYAAEVDAAGRFVIRGLPDATYSVAYSHPSLTDAVATDIAVTGAGTAYVDYLQADLGGSVAGHVTDQATGDPLAGVVVAPLGEESLRSAVTDEDGYYLLAGLSAGTHTISAHDEALRAGPCQGVQVVAGQTTDGVDFAMAAGADLEGTVTDGGTAEVLAEATVWVVAPDEAIVTMATTDDAGAFAMTNLPAGAYTVRVQRYPYSTHEETVDLTLGETATVAVELSAANRAYGTITAQDATPLPGVPVLLFSLTEIQYATLTDEEGRYDFAPLPLGDYGLMFPDGSHRHVFELSEGTPTYEWDIVLDVGSISGLVLASDGVSPVVTARVALLTDGSPVLTTHVSDDGEFSFTHVAPGTYDVLATDASSFFALAGGVVVTGGADVAVPDIVAGSAELTVTFLDETTALPPATLGTAVLTLPGTGGEDARSVAIDMSDDGTALFTGLVPSTYEIAAAEVDLAHDPVEVVVAAGTNTETVQLYEGATFTGQVQTGGGSPLANISVFLFDTATGAVIGEALSASNGSFAMASVPEGTYRAVACDLRGLSGAAYAVTSVDGLTFETGGSVDTAISMSLSDITVSGTVANAEHPDSPPSEAEVRVYDADGLLVASALPNITGSYTILGLSPGTYTLVGAASGFAPAQDNIAVVAGQSLSGVELPLAWKGLCAPLPAFPVQDILCSHEAAGATKTGATLAPTIGTLGKKPNFWQVWDNLMAQVTDTSWWADSDIVNHPMFKGFRKWLDKVHNKPVAEPQLQGGFKAECEKANRWYQYALLKQRRAREMFDAWLQRWEGACVENYANLGMFGVNLLKLSGSLLAATNATKIDAFNYDSEGAIKSFRNLQAQALAKQDYAEIKRLDGLIAMVGDAWNKFSAFATGSNITCIGASATSVPELIRNLTKIHTWSGTDWLGFAGELTGMANTLKDFLSLFGKVRTALEGIPGANKLFKVLGPISDALGTASEGINGVQRAMANVRDLARLEAAYRSLIEQRDDAYRNALVANVECNHPTHVQDPVPDPPQFHWPYGGGGNSHGGASKDPNDKTTTGIGSRGWIPDDATIFYTVHFENLPSVELPSQQVVVTDTLDTNLDWSTFELDQIGFNLVTLDVPDGLQDYSTQTTVATDPDHPVNITVTFDPDTGLITWDMMSIDPQTGQLTEDPLAGFLPPNDAEHHGEGFLSFTAQLLPALDDGTQILNQATIVFDPAGGANPPIDTNQTVNTIGDVVVTDLTPGRGTNKTTFIDLDGDPVQVTFGGKAGSAQVIRLVEPDGSGDIVELILEGTDAKSSLAIKTKGKGAETSVGDIVVHGALKQIAAKTTNLVGDLTVDEWLGKLLLADVADDHTITIGGSGDDKPLTLVFGQVQDLVLDSDTPIKALTVTEWLDSDATPDQIIAPWLGKLTTKGRKANAKKGIVGLAGDFEATLCLDGTGDPKLTLGKAKVAGSVTRGTWSITGPVGAIAVGIDFCAALDALSVKSMSVKRNLDGAMVNLTQAIDPKLKALSKLVVTGWTRDTAITSAGHVAKFQTGGMDGSCLLLGMGGTELPDEAADFTGEALLRSFTVKGIKDGKLYLDSFIDSDVAAWCITKANVREVVTDNASDPFGFAWCELKSLTWLEGRDKFKWPEKKPTDWPDDTGDFVATELV